MLIFFYQSPHLCDEDSMSCNEKTEPDFIHELFNTSLLMKERNDSASSLLTTVQNAHPEFSEKMLRKRKENELVVNPDENPLTSEFNNHHLDLSFFNCSKKSATPPPTFDIVSVKSPSPTKMAQSQNL